MVLGEFQVLWIDEVLQASVNIYYCSVDITGVIDRSRRLLNEFDV